MAAASPVPSCSNLAPLHLTAAAPHLACSAPPLPDGPCPVCPRLAQEFEPWRQAGYWKAMHDRAVERAVQREALLQQEVEHPRAHLRLREQQLCGRKAETRAAATPAAPRPDEPPRRPRG